MARFCERPILIYHQIGDYPSERLGDYGITKDAFRAHLDRLGEMGLEVIPLERMIAQMKGEAPFRPRAVSLTFDGGFRDGAETVLPLLAERGYSAAFFVPADFIGEEHAVFGALFPCMEWGQIRELAAAGMTVGSFGRRGAILEDLPPAGRREDARAARATLEDGLGRPVRYHAYMEGYPEGALRRWFIEEGFEAVLTQCPTFRWRSDPYRIGRIQVDDEDPNILKTKASDPYLYFKDTRVWRLIRGIKADRLMHRFYALFEKERGGA